MKKLAVFLAAILLFAAFLPAGRIAARAESGGVYALVDDYLDRAAKRAHVSALSAVIVDRNGVLLEKQVGRGATADTPFLLGSVSKSFTAACVMQLAEQGKIELNAPVSRYLPDARDGDRITVRQLLNHTGGLGEHQNLTNYKIVNEQGKHVYANVNYALLGQIVAQASGSSYVIFCPMFFATPLWVAAFVPDLWFTVVLSAALLFAGGVYKVAFMLLGRTLQSYCDRDSSTARSALRSE